MVSRKPAFLYDLWGKHNYQALFVYRSDLGKNSCHFLPYFDYNSVVFLIILQDKLHSFNIQDDRSSASRPSITTRSLTRTSTRNLTRSPTRSPTRTRIQTRTYPTPDFKGRFWNRKVHPHHPWSSRRGSQSTVFTMPAIFACA